MKQAYSTLTGEVYKNIKRDILFYDEIRVDLSWTRLSLDTYNWFNDLGFRKCKNIDMNLFEANMAFLRDKNILSEFNIITNVMNFLDSQGIMSKTDVESKMKEGLYGTTDLTKYFFALYKDLYVRIVDIYPGGESYKYLLQVTFDLCYSWSIMTALLPKSNIEPSAMIMCYYLSDHITESTILVQTIIDEIEENEIVGLITDASMFQKNASDKLLDRYSPFRKNLYKSQECCNMVVSHIPVPDDRMPLDELISWKNSDDNKIRYETLHRWIQKSIKSNVSTNELKQELEYFTLEFEKALLHKDSGQSLRSYSI